MCSAISDTTMAVQIEDAQQSQVGWLFGRGGTLKISFLSLCSYSCKYSFWL